MSSVKYAQLFKSSARYRRWFKAWWSEDFSLTGRKKSLERNPQIERFSFGGRTWPTGWAPPHDLDGNPNPDFTPVTRTTTQQHRWAYYRSDLVGCFIDIDELDHIVPYTGDLSWCFFFKKVKGAIGHQRVSFSNAFLGAGSIVSLSGHGADLQASNLISLEEVIFNLSRGTKYEVDSAIIDGGAKFRGEEISGTCDRISVRGNLVLTGSVNGKGVRCNSLSVLQESNRVNNYEINLPNLRSKSANLSGYYKNIALPDSHFTELHIRSEGETKSIDFSGATGNSVSVTGEVNKLNGNQSNIKSSLSLVRITSDVVSIARCDFGGAVSIIDLSVKELFLDESECRGVTTFTRSKFNDGLYAREVVFNQPAYFSKCAFPGRLIFSGSQFKAGADFRTGSGSDVASDTIYSQVGEADFSGVVFDGDAREVCADFDSRVFIEAATFEESRFTGVPKFFGCKFHEDTTFRGAEFIIVSPSPSFLRAVSNLDWKVFLLGILKTYRFPYYIDGLKIIRLLTELLRPLRERRVVQNKRLSNYERAYNALRQRFEFVGNAKEERRFHNYELRARRRRIDGDVPLTEGCISRAYDLMSGYGQSISRPILILIFVCWIGFSLLYLLIAQQFTGSAFLEALVFSGRQMVKPFSAWSRDFVLPASYDVYTQGGTLSPWIGELLGTGSESLVRTTIVRLAASFQSLLSLVMVFLSGLAIRRTFGLG